MDVGLGTRRGDRLTAASAAACAGRAARAAAGLALLLLSPAACRDATNSGADAAVDGDVPSISAGVAIGVFGAPGPESGVQDPAFLVGCAKNGFAGVQVVYIQPDNMGAISEGTFTAVFTRTGAHDHIEIGSGELVAEIDEVVGSGSDTSAGSDDAPFVYPATVTADESFLDTQMHTFAAHVLNPAMPTVSGLGTWNSDMLVSCP